MARRWLHLTQKVTNPSRLRTIFIENAVLIYIQHPLIVDILHVGPGQLSLELVPDHDVPPRAVDELPPHRTVSP